MSDIKFIRNHFNKKSIDDEINLISEKLKQLGYFLNSLDSIQKKENTHIAFFSLRKKTTKVILKLPNELEIDLSEFNIKNKTIEVTPQNLSFFLSKISSKLDAKGKSFSEVRLKNIKSNNDTLFADLYIHPSKKRTIDKIIVKGYERFSKAHLKHFFGLKKGTIFNKKTLDNVSKRINFLDFVSEIKRPETLFTKDSTIIYLYLQKNNSNTFDGLINFSSKENNKINLNGHLNLKLENILHSGEKLHFTWKANSEKLQNLNLLTEIPYIFNSRFTPSISFNIHKQDSSFLNTSFNSKISLLINPKSNLALTYNSTSSKNTLNNVNSKQILDFENTFFGIEFTYRIPNKSNFYNDLFFLSINPSIGNRSSSSKKTQQHKINFESYFHWSLNYKNSFFIRNHTKYLHSDNFLENEQFRIGGAKSIRGFDEESIFTTQFSYFNIEYRYLTSRKSYLYSISDFGRIKNNLKTTNLSSFGLGYLFNTNNYIVNIAYIIPKNKTFKLNNSKLLLNFSAKF